MINTKRALAISWLTLGFMAGVSSQTWAAPVVWFSDTATPTAITNPTITTTVGGTADLYLFASLGSAPLETITGLGLSITNTTTGIASGSLTAADWSNPTYGSPPLLPTQPRWNTSTTTGLSYSFTPGQLTPSLNAVAVFGAHGLNGGHASPGIDPTFNVATGGLLVGKFTVTGLSVGSTPVFLGVGPSLISGTGFTSVNFGAADATAVSPGTVGATSAVLDATITVVPEPSSFIIVGCVLTLLCALSRARTVWCSAIEG